MRRVMLVGALMVTWLLHQSPAMGSIQIQTPSAAGAVATSPWIAASSTITVTTLTNGSANWRTVHVQIFDEDWRAIDFDCQLSPLETTYFVFEETAFNSGETNVTSECSSRITGGTNIVQTRRPFGSRGFVVFHEVDGVGIDTSLEWSNALISDFTVIDFLIGAAFSANAWHVEQRNPNPDGDLDFDGDEYAELNGTLVTGFVAPDDDLSTLLIMYGLDGAPEAATPVQNSGYVYDDDENPLSGFHGYDCFSFFRLEQVFGSNVRRDFGPAGSPYFVGHATFSARSGGPGLKPVPQVGWMIQLGRSGMQLNGGDDLGGSTFDEMAPGFVSWGRPMLIAPDPLPSVLSADPIVRP